MVKWISCAWLLRRAFLCSFCIPVETKIITKMALQVWVGPSWYEKCFLTWISQRSVVSFHEPRPFCIPMKTRSSSNRRLLRHRFVATEWTRKAWIFVGGKLACTQSFAPASKQLCIGNSPLSLSLPPSTSRVTRPWQQPVGPLIEVHIFLGCDVGKVQEVAGLILFELYFVLES